MGALYQALLHSLDGLRFGLSSERAIRQEACLLVLSAPAALFVGDAGWRSVVLMAAMLAVLCVELLNTAIERLCDLVQPEFDLRIKRIKDLASAACLCAQLIAASAWGVVLFWRLWAA